MKDYIWVCSQFILFGVYLIPVSMVTWQGHYLWATAGVILMASGLIMVILALLRLNTNLSPFPSPGRNSELITNGIFKWVRHPIYGGIILVATGYAIFDTSFYKLLIAGVLYIFFYYKSNFEEKLLKERYSSYEAYSRQTSRFFPDVTKVTD
ncbi:methyltransferase family protein [Robertkochia aurantiaca]|uniref:methyltransferase family protein n=1 Tax=Robertkochia aurantiaca TaxID=2873700 RepID=UPI001CC92A4D|nr:isoprenylcysteine carboxylmethyltransferase family protein [Robertkochia sp. 3YJGBD-33]